MGGLPSMHIATCVVNFWEWIFVGSSKATKCMKILLYTIVLTVIVYTVVIVS